MAMGLELYPPSIDSAPPGLTRPTLRHRLSTVLVLLSLFAFLALYLALVAASGYVVYVAFTYPMGVVNRWSLLLKAGAIACSVMLFLFLLKGLFKRHQADEADNEEIREQDHPELFAFVRRLCREAKAPFPHRIYVSPEVNAAVFYNMSLLNLVLPVRKNLLIGLGLVNVLPMNEFKAVLAHEFGHFTQSAAAGTYVSIANRIIWDMVHGRDYWDDLLEQWRETDFRLAIFGWLLSAVVWVLRMLLSGVFLVINLAQYALMRQREFQADLVAVSVCGSDAIVNSLARLQFANEALSQAVHDLRLATHHGLYSRDLFFHQARAAAHLRAERKDPRLGLPPPAAPDGASRSRVFQPSAKERSSLWDTHPSDYEREENAKRVYLPGPQDDRSPWLLFRNPEQLRESLTVGVYQSHLTLPNGATLAEPEKVQAFIDTEHTTTTFNPRYYGLYDQRYLEPGDVDALARALHSAPFPPERIRQTYERLYGGSLESWMDAHRQRQEDCEFLTGIAEGGAGRQKHFEYRGHRYPRSGAAPLAKARELELEEDAKWLAALDSDVFQAHYQMAVSTGTGAEQELWGRYRFQVPVEEILRELSTQQARIHGLLAAVHAARGRLSEEDAATAAGYFREARRRWRAVTPVHSSFQCRPWTG